MKLELITITPKNSYWVIFHYDFAQPCCMDATPIFWSLKNSRRLLFKILLKIICEREFQHIWGTWRLLSTILEKGFLGVDTYMTNLQETQCLPLPRWLLSIISFILTQWWEILWKYIFHNFIGYSSDREYNIEYYVRTDRSASTRISTYAKLLSRVAKLRRGMHRL